MNPNDKTMYDCVSQEDADKAAELLDAAGAWCNCTDNKAEGDILYDATRGVHVCQKCGKVVC